MPQIKSRRFVIEGEWTGYTAGQRRVVHRQVYPARRKHLREWAERTYGIQYTDGTFLLLRVRDCEPRERVEPVDRGYGGLIELCAVYDVATVAELAEAQDAIRAEAQRKRA